MTTWRQGATLPDRIGPPGRDRTPIRDRREAPWMTDSMIHDEDCEFHTPCDCGRGEYHSCQYSSCYECFLDRRSEYVDCIYCGKWHSPEFDTCFRCRPQGRDEAARDLKLMILARDSFACRYCGAEQGSMKIDPRKAANGDASMYPVTLHIDHIQPCYRGGTADPWNLQVLCSACNTGKGREWGKVTRHYRARCQVIAAYMTYLWQYLDKSQQETLAREAHIAGITHARAYRLATQDYIWRVKARHGS